MKIQMKSLTKSNQRKCFVLFENFIEILFRSASTSEIEGQAYQISPVPRIDLFDR